MPSSDSAGSDDDADPGCDIDLDQWNVDDASSAGGEEGTVPRRDLLAERLGGSGGQIEIERWRASFWIFSFELSK
jgi:hypothetical protein